MSFTAGLRFFQYSYYIILLFLFEFTPEITRAQDSNTKTSILSKGFYFDPLIFDPTQCQVSGGLFKLWKSGNEKDGLYIPVSLGFQQSFIRFEKNNRRGIELGMGAAAFTQYEIIKLEPKLYRGEMLNADYKVTGFVNTLLNCWSFRLQLFHVSSHLSDDYILRNHINTPDPGTMNYEQSEITASYCKNNLRIYGGLGYVITKNAVRDRISCQTGIVYENSISARNNFGFIAGMDIKLFEQNNYVPDLKIGSGIKIGLAEKIHMAFLIEYFQGHLPYSTLDYGKIRWFGMSTVIIPASRG